MTSPGNHPWPEWVQCSSWGRSMWFQVPGMDWVRQRSHRVHVLKTVRKNNPSDSLFLSSLFLRKGSFLKIQNCLFSFCHEVNVYFQEIHLIFLGLSLLECLVIPEVPGVNNNTKHLLSINIYHMMKQTLCMDYLLYLYSSSFKYCHSHLMWGNWGLEK